MDTRQVIDNINQLLFATDNEALNSSIPISVNRIQANSTLQTFFWCALFVSLYDWALQ